MTTIHRLREIEEYLHEKIPLTRAMAVSVESWEDGELVLTAPLEPNHNHLGTAFGGSLGAMAMLAGYALIWLELGDRACHVVISDNEMKFLTPVRGTIRARCHTPDKGVMSRFREQYERHGKARARLHVAIEDESGEAVQFEGTYVARRPARTGGQSVEHTEKV